MRLPDPPDYSPDGPLAFAIEARFRQTKTVPEDPHEYVVRAKLDEAGRLAYDLFLEAVVTHGQRLPFQWSADYRVNYYHYLRIGEWWHWEAPRGFMNRKLRGWERAKTPGWWEDEPTVDVPVQETLL